MIELPLQRADRDYFGLPKPDAVVMRFDFDPDLAKDAVRRWAERRKNARTGSSAVERSVVNRMAAGSIPARCAT